MTAHDTLTAALRERLEYAEDSARIDERFQREGLAAYERGRASAFRECLTLIREYMAQVVR